MPPFIRVLLITIALAAGLSACSEATVGEDVPRAQVNGSGVPGSFYEVEVNGMDCIVWIHEYGVADNKDSFSGLTCDWSPR
jgi:hypothetical protein